MRLEQDAADVRVQGLDTDGPCEVMAVRWIGSNAPDAIYHVGTATRSGEIKAKLEASRSYDLIICDKAHGLSTSVYGGETA